MLRTRLILVAACALTVWLIFLLPKSVVENEAALSVPDPAIMLQDSLHTVPDEVLQPTINSLRAQIPETLETRNSVIFADSLASLYDQVNRFDSAAYYAEKSATYFDTVESIEKAGDAYYKAFTFSMDQTKRMELARKSSELFQSVMEKEPSNLRVKTKMAMTFVVTSSPMQGISLLKEVLNENPEFQPALFNMGMLSVQSGQYAKAIDWLTKLIAINQDDVQGTLLLGVAYAGNGDKEKARKQFERVKKLDSDPAVQQQANSYLKDLQ